MKPEKFRLIVSLALAVCLGTGVALAQGTSTINRWFIGGGGGTATGGNVSISGTLGQSIAGPSSGGEVTIQNGFWVGSAATVDASSEIYLPLVINNWPPVPEAPVLNTITDPGANPTYLVDWEPASQADTYILEKATGSDFVDATAVYTGTNTDHTIDSVGIARYYYRVKAHNQFGDSSWSNAQSVEVHWEKETNDDAKTQANGPIASGPTYYGVFPADDIKDYFYFNLPSDHSIELRLTNIAPDEDYDVYLRDANLSVVGESDEYGNADEHILTGELQSGQYYIQIYNNSKNGSTQPYHLRVVYE
jgi:hypothetical protein